MFWFFSALCGAPQFRTEIRDAQKGQVENDFFHKTYLVYYPLVLVMLLLNCLPDDAPKVNIYAEAEVSCLMAMRAFQLE